MSNTIASLMAMQAADVNAAQLAAADWLNEMFGLSTGAVRLEPSAAAINSFHGFVEYNGQEVFFKTCADPEIIRTEHENIQLLLDAGYPTLEAIGIHEANDLAILFYPIVSAPKGRTLLEANETAGDTEAATRLLAAQSNESKHLLAMYRKSAVRSGPDAPAISRIHALFYERLADSSRWGAFYASANVPLPQGGSVPTSDVFSRRWKINGVAQPRSLVELVDEGRTVLDPEGETLTVIGHGDAHLDNVFVLDDETMLYFDAAFSGRHSPMLDVAKNVFETTFSGWMYYPNEVSAALELSVDISDSEVTIDYGQWITPVRKQVYASKQETLLQPMFDWLQAEHASPYGLRPFHLALMCAAMVTANPLNAAKYPANVAWLALAVSAQLGNLDVDQEMLLEV